MTAKDKSRHAQRMLTGIPHTVPHSVLADAYVQGDWRRLKRLGVDRVVIKRLKRVRAKNLRLKPGDLTPSPEALIGAALY